MKTRKLVHSLTRILTPRPTPSPDPAPKLDDMIKTIGEIRELITARQAAIRATAALVVLGLVLGATPVWSAERHDGLWLLQTCEHAAQHVLGGTLIPATSQGYDCAILVQGMMMGFVQMEQRWRDSGRIAEMPVCLPESVTVGQLILLTVQQLRASPQFLHHDAAFLLPVLIGETFRCPTRY